MAPLAAKRDMQVKSQRGAGRRRSTQGRSDFPQKLRLPERKRRIIRDKIIAYGRLLFCRGGARRGRYYGCGHDSLALFRFHRAKTARLSMEPVNYSAGRVIFQMKKSVKQLAPRWPMM